MRASREDQRLYDSLRGDQRLRLSQKGVGPRDLAAARARGTSVEPFRDQDLHVAPEDLLRHPDAPLFYEAKEDTDKQNPRITDKEQASLLKTLFFQVNLPGEGEYGMALCDDIARITPSKLSSGSRSTDATGIHQLLCPTTYASSRARSGLVESEKFEGLKHMAHATPVLALMPPPVTAAAAGEDIHAPFLPGVNRQRIIAFSNAKAELIKNMPAKQQAHHALTHHLNILTPIVKRATWVPPEAACASSSQEEKDATASESTTETHTAVPTYAGTGAMVSYTELYHLYVTGMRALMSWNHAMLAEEDSLADLNVSAQANKLQIQAKLTAMDNDKKRKFTDLSYGDIPSHAGQSDDEGSPHTYQQQQGRNYRPLGKRAKRRLRYQQQGHAHKQHSGNRNYGGDERDHDYAKLPDGGLEHQQYKHGGKGQGKGKGKEKGKGKGK